MAAFRGLQPSLAGGVLGPSLHARVDLAKYQTGLKNADNMFVHAHGGVSNRAGLEIVGETRNSTVARQITFIFDAETNQTYDLVFSDFYMRVYREGAPVLNAAKFITAATQASPGVFTCAAHGYTASQEVVLSDLLGMTALNGRHFRIGTVTTNTFTLLDMFGAAVNTSTMPAYGGGGQVKSVYEVVSPYAEEDIPLLVTAQEKDVMYIAHKSYAPRKLSRLADNNWTLTAPTFTPQMAAPGNVSSYAYYSFKNDGSLVTIQFVVTAVSAGGAESLASGSTSSGVYIVNEDGRKTRLSWNASAGAAFYKIYRTAAGSDNGVLATSSETYAEINFTHYQGDGSSPPGVAGGGAPPTPTGLVASQVVGKEARYKVAAISATTQEEGIPGTETTVRNALTFAGNANHVKWDAVAGAERYVVYRSDNGQFGYIGETTSLHFIDENITPDLAQGPQEANNPFASAGDYPGCVTFFEQRLAFASMDNEPSRVVLGQSANYENFGSATPATASDTIDFRIRSREKNEIRALVPMRGLAVFTSAAEFTVSGGSQDFLTPSNIVIRPQTYRGMSEVQPIVVGNIILFSQARGCVIRDFSYDFASDNFTGNDLTILARHLFDGKEISSWAYAQSPHSIVYVVFNDGTAASMTYLREHEVWAWMPISTDGAFEDVTVIPENSEDVPYFIVRRTVQSFTKRYIERMRSRLFDSVEDGFFVDSGLSYGYSGGPSIEVTTISGLHHLEGKSVVALADGNVIRSLTVSAGQITLPVPASKVHVGLPFEAFIQTLDIDMGMLKGLGTATGRQKTIGEVHARVEKSRGAWIGPNENNLREWKQRSGEGWDEPTQLFTGVMSVQPHTDYDAQGSIIIRQKDPLPLTVLSVAPEIVVGG